MTVAVWNVVLHEDETTLGFASRVAARFNMSLSRFLHYKDIDYRVFRQNDEAQVKRFASQWSLDIDVLRSRMWAREGKWSWYGPTDNRYKGMQWGVVRYCPICVMEDIEQGRGPSETRPYQRLAWWSPHLEVCCAHAVRLRRTPEPLAKANPGDFALAISARLAEIEAEAASTEKEEITSSDLYFEDRMIHPWNRKGFLDQMTTYAAYEACRVFGRLDSARGINVERDQVARGFEIIRDGKKAINAYFDKRVSTISYPEHVKQFKGCIAKSKLYKDVYELLISQPDEKFGPLPAIIREDGLSRLPLSSDDDFLGPVGKRRFHSIRSAALEHGMEARHVRTVFLRHGLIDESELWKVDSDIVISAEKADELLRARNIPLVTLAEFCARTDINWPSVRSLMLQGVLTNGSNTKKKFEFPADEVDRFIESVFLGRRYAANKSYMVDILTAFHKTNIPVFELLAMINGGVLTAYSSTKAHSESMKTILLDERQLKPHSRHLPPQGNDTVLTSTQASKYLGTSDATMKHLLGSGLLPYKQGPSRTRLLAIEDVNAFKASFISLFEVCDLVRGATRPVKEWLDANDVVRRIDPDLPEAATFYSREEVLALIDRGSRPEKLSLTHVRWPQRAVIGQEKAQRRKTQFSNET